VKVRNNRISSSSKTYLTLEDAKSFLQELSKISCLDYDDAEADALIERCDENHDGWITLKEFHHLFFASTKVLQISKCDFGLCLTHHRSHKVAKISPKEDFGGTR
jgi:hypothetical protein